MRFDRVQKGPFACVDATSHVCMMLERGAEWARALGEDTEPFEETREELAEFVRSRLFCEETGFFHDVWSVNDPGTRRIAFEGMWPVVAGIASEEQAAAVIDGNLLNAERFFTEHPVATVAVSDPAFEQRCWRGPAWNSMTLWAARGCLRYGRADAAKQILERALDGSARVFERTGTVWEFYHSRGGEPESVQRKPSTPYNMPCRDYLGHNPLAAMALMWEEAGD